MFRINTISSESTTNSTDSELIPQICNVVYRMLTEEKWRELYPIVIRSWQDNWDKLSEYFQYTPAIRKLIYTTNTVEGYHRQNRKVTKNKGVFPSDTALEKLVYLAYRNIRKKWTIPLANWATISQQQLAIIKFGERFLL